MDIRGIAKRAKVSTATVSRTINHVPTVDPQLAKRVWKVVNELGFYVNTQARSLVSGKTRIFGLVVSEITNPFFPEIVQSFEEMAVLNRYEILLASTGNDAKRTEHAVRRMIERRVDGVAVLTFGMEEDVLKNLRFRKVPLVLVDVAPALPMVCNIRINYQQGIRQAVQHLAALGHERIGFISGPLELPSANARKNAFFESLREIEMDVHKNMVIEGDHTIEGGVQGLAKFANMRKLPTAVLCSNDMTAIGVMREAYELGIRIPDDLSVIGFDDIRMAQFTTPPLSTVQMSQSKLGKIAFKALMTEVERETPAAHGTEYTLNTNLVLRRTTALAKGDARSRNTGKRRPLAAGIRTGG